MKINRSYSDTYGNAVTNTDEPRTTGPADKTQNSRASTHRGSGGLQDRFENAGQPGGNQSIQQMLTKPPYLQKQDLPEGGLNTPLQSREGDDPLTPEEREQARSDAEMEQAAADNYQREDGSWDVTQIEHDMLNVARARRLADDLLLDGRDREGFDPRGTFDPEDRERLVRYADWMSMRMLGLPEDVFQRAADLADTTDSRAMQYLYGHNGLGGGLGRTPASDSSSDPMDPARGHREEQRDPLQHGQRGQTGPNIGPQPGQGGTLTGHHGNARGTHGRTPTGGHSQKGGAGSSFGGSNESSGVKGGHESSSNGAPGNSQQGTSHGGQPPVGAYRHETGNSYSLNAGSSNSGGSSGSQTTGNSDTGKKDKVGKNELGASESSGDVKTIPVTGLPGDPETGAGRSGDDLGGGRMAKYKVKGVSQQEKDLIGPAFGTTTGADDEERPAVGGTSGTVATNTSESRANDVGGTNAPRRSSGGSVGRFAGEELLRKLGLWEKLKPGGPDPEK